MRYRVNAAHYDFANTICELFVVKKFNNDAVLNK